MSLKRGLCWFRVGQCGSEGRVWSGWRGIGCSRKRRGQYGLAVSVLTSLQVLRKTRKKQTEATVSIQKSGLMVGRTWEGN